MSKIRILGIHFALFQLAEFEDLTESDNSTPLINTFRNVQADNCRKLVYAEINTASQYTYAPEGSG